MKDKIIKISVIIFILIVFISLIAGQNFFFKLRQLLAGKAVNSDLLKLQSENLSLRSRLESLENNFETTEPQTDSYQPALVYASYPFNDKSELTINLGKNQNISPGDAVAVSNMLIGQIKSVNPNYSIVRTIFDPHWEFPVYIGPSLARGLLQAGVEPRVVLISKKEEINPDDLIITADPKILPSHLVIGTVSLVEGDASSPFWEVSINLPYNINDLRQVFIYPYDSSNPSDL